MTYQSTAHPAPAALSADSLRRIGGGLRRFLAGIVHGMMTASTAHNRYEQVQRLQAKTDVELAALKIRCEDIVHHVFKDLYYI